MAITVSISHVDTCTPGYLLRSANGKREMLLQVPVDNTTTYAELLNGLQAAWEQMDGINCEDFFHKSVPDNSVDFDIAANTELVGMMQRVANNLDKVFDPDIGPSGEEQVYAYFHVTWDF